VVAAVNTIVVARCAALSPTISNFNTSYNVTVATQPTNPSQTCVAANGTGTTSGNSNVTNITMTCTTNPPRFIYVTGGGSNSISAYAIGSGTFESWKSIPL
jgi:hypothetical protein